MRIPARHMCTDGLLLPCASAQTPVAHMGYGFLWTYIIKDGRFLFEKDFHCNWTSFINASNSSAMTVSKICLFMFYQIQGYFVKNHPHTILRGRKMTFWQKVPPLIHPIQTDFGLHDWFNSYDKVPCNFTKWVCLVRGGSVNNGANNSSLNFNFSVTLWNNNTAIVEWAQ